ncbi:MAG TPA: hypothetical protein VMW93_07145 [bacterium]|nr:hypothetical protein [bacterium]
MNSYRALRKIGRTASLTIATALAALLFTGCLFSPPEIEDPEAPPVMNSPANVLKTIEIAYNQRNIRYYKSALSENFVFYFDPRDVGQTPPVGTYIIPETWSYTDDWRATDRMFQKAYDISLTIPTARVGTPEPDDNIYKANNISIKLLVMVEELNGYIADMGYCNFEFEKYKNEANEDRWRLRKWWDNTST